MAELHEGEAAFRYGMIEDPRFQAEIDAWFRENDPYHYSTLRTSVVPTIIDAGFRRNVIPSEASAMLDTSEPGPAVVVARMWRVSIASSPR